jgi:hypothetical protein
VNRLGQGMQSRPDGMGKLLPAKTLQREHGEDGGEEPADWTGAPGRQLIAG